MLSVEDNRLLTESGAGTPMGALLRRFWLPVLLSEELPEADGPPKKIAVMGEALLAFRDTRGRVGVIDQHCPHRGANLWLGRNEECGIRCVYHGWKFDVDGRCVDMPTSYPDLDAKDKMRIKAYPAREQGGMVWAYMGPPERMPELPALEVALVSPAHRYVSKKWQDCNWVQAAEGSIDTAHFSFAHLTFDKGEDEDLDIGKHLKSPISRMSFDHVRWIAEDPRPVIKVNPHAAGLTIAGGRIAADDNIYWRIAQFLMPIHAYAPSAMPGEPMFGQSFVPVSDTSCWIYTYAWNPQRPLTDAERAMYKAGNGVIAEVDENYVPLRNLSNNYLIDRQLQKTKSYTGIEGVSEQDAAVQDSQGPIADRTREHLGPTDIGILHFRKLMLDAARDLGRGKESRKPQGAPIALPCAPAPASPTRARTSPPSCSSASATPPATSATPAQARGSAPRLACSECPRIWHSGLPSTLGQAQLFCGDTLGVDAKGLKYLTYSVTLRRSPWWHAACAGRPDDAC